jgi:hypothetical protein
MIKEENTGFEDIYFVALESLDTDEWSNVILWRLAVAVGWAEVGQGEVDVVATELLEEVESRLRSSEVTH